MKNLITFQYNLKKYFQVMVKKGKDPNPWYQMIMYTGGSGTLENSKHFHLMGQFFKWNSTKQPSGKHFEEEWEKYEVMSN